jgi:hypothetical protein
MANGARVGRVRSLHRSGQAAAATSSSSPTDWRSTSWARRSRARELERVGTPVTGVLAAPDVPFPLELVDEADHGRAVDGEDVGQGLL